MARRLPATQVTMPTSTRRPRFRPTAAVTLACCACSGSVDPPASPESQFRDARPVVIAGYSGDAMEPFLSRDGAWLFFNNRNDPADATDLHVARTTSPDTFRYVGPLAGANATGALDGVASMDAAGRFYWVSTRSYAQTLATLHQGAFADGAVTGAALVAGTLVRGAPGWLTMDAEVTADGQAMYFADARFDGGAVPAESKLRLARRQGGRFDVDPGGDDVLRAVNASATLVYAPASSADGLELFFTGLSGGGAPVIFRATRSSPGAPFGTPVRVAAAAGFVEAPTLSPDGRSLYFHRLDGQRFAIYRLVR